MDNFTRKTAAPARGAPKPPARPPTAKPLPRPAPPRASSAPKPSQGRGSTYGARPLLAALAGLVETFGRRPVGPDVHLVWFALQTLLGMVRRYLANPAGFRLKSNENGVALLPQQPAPAPSPPAPKSLEQLRAEADALTQGIAGELVDYAATLARLGESTPRAPQLAAGLRALLAPPALAPAQRRLAVGLLDAFGAQGELVDVLAIAHESTGDLRSKWLLSASRDEIRCAINEVESAIEVARSLAWKVGDRLCFSAEEVTGQLPRSGTPGQVAALALLLHADNENKADAEAADIKRAHRAWTAPE